jgi:hypothetical protein
MAPHPLAQGALAEMLGAAVLLHGSRDWIGDGGGIGRRGRLLRPARTLGLDRHLELGVPGGDGDTAAARSGIGRLGVEGVDRLELVDDRRRDDAGDRQAVAALKALDALGGACSEYAVLPGLEARSVEVALQSAHVASAHPLGQGPAAEGLAGGGERRGGGYGGGGDG